jgi:hypothetical protein
MRSAYQKRGLYATWSLSSDRTIVLNQEQRKELHRVRGTHPKFYMRTRAAAILKVAAGLSILQVAHSGLLTRYDDNMVRDWINRYLSEGVDGLKIRSGRGRKPAFFP